MSRRFVSRREAVAFLFRIMANYKLSSEDEQIARDMIHCIEAELENFHEWGADTSEAVILHFPKTSRHIRMMDREELFEIYKKYRFIPSPSDKEEAEAHIAHMLDVFNSMIVTDDKESEKETEDKDE